MFKRNEEGVEIQKLRMWLNSSFEQLVPCRYTDPNFIPEVHILHTFGLRLLPDPVVVLKSESDLVKTWVLIDR